MTRTCTVCAHPERDAVDEALIRGEPLRSIATRVGLQHSSIQRHKQGGHLPGGLVAAYQESELERGRTLLDRVQELEDKARAILERSEKEGRTVTSLAALRELRGIVELMGKVTGELRETPQVAINVLTSGDWLTVQTAIFEALNPHPEARQAVASRLRTLEVK